MTSRLFFSLFLGAFLGVVLGLIIGGNLDPLRTINEPIDNLQQSYKDTYTVMVAAGYRADGDLNGAVFRLERLGILREDVPTYVQDVTTRYIRESERLEDIYHLVALSDGLGVVTDEMAPLLAVINSTP